MSDTSQDPVIKGTATEHEAQRRMLAQEAVRHGRLPARSADQTWGGPGSGETCSMCSLAISAQDVGYELEFAQCGQGSITRYLHIHCFSAWDYVCRNPDTGSTVGRDDEETPKLPKLNGHTRGPEP